MGLVDYGRVFHMRQVITALSREGANLASRGTALTNTCDTLVVSARPLDINSSGYIILSQVVRDNSGTLVLTNQVKRGGFVSSSKVGTKGATGSAVRLPVTGLPATNQSLMVTEVYYRFTPSTPIGRFLGLAPPSGLYDVSYF
jgi:Flp pilus assembly protein TadG